MPPSWGCHWPVLLKSCLMEGLWSSRAASVPAEHLQGAGCCTWHLVLSEQPSRSKYLPATRRTSLPATTCLLCPHPVHAKRRCWSWAAAGALGAYLWQPSTPNPASLPCPTAAPSAPSSRRRQSELGGYTRCCTGLAWVPSRQAAAGWGELYSTGLAWIATCRPLCNSITMLACS